MCFKRLLRVLKSGNQNGTNKIFPCFEEMEINIYSHLLLIKERVVVAALATIFHNYNIVLM